MQQAGSLSGARVAVIGAGAMGAILAYALDRAGARVSLLARGAHLEAIRSDGLILDTDTGQQVLRLPAESDPAQLGPQEHLILSVKSHSLAALMPILGPMIGPGTTVTAALNGIPWWYFHATQGTNADRHIAVLDPDGVIAATIPAQAVIGCVLHLAAQIEAPGHVCWTAGRRIILGEPDGALSPRLEALGAALRAGGLEVELSPRIRDDIWTKLIGNASANPIAAITRQTPGRIFGQPDLRALSRAVMAEVEAVARAHGAHLTMDLDTRLDLGRTLGDARLSMLQDRELGRPLELDSIIDAVIELGALTEQETPLLRILATLARATVAADHARGGPPAP